MAARKFSMIGGAVALLLLGGVLAVTAAPTSEELTGTSRTAPYAWQANGTVLVWAIRSDDLISCRSAGFELRRVQHARPDVRFVVAAVGVDTSWVASMLRSERIRATVEWISESEYRTLFASAGTPSLFAFEDGTIQSHVLSFRTPTTSAIPATGILDRLSVRSSK